MSEDPIQHNDGLRINLIGTSRQIVEYTVRLRPIGVGLILTGSPYFIERVEYFGRKALPLVCELEAQRVATSGAANADTREAEATTFAAWPPGLIPTFPIRTRSIERAWGGSVACRFAKITMSHTFTELTAPPPPFVRYVDSRSADASPPACSVSGGTVEAAVPVLRLTGIDPSFGGIQTLNDINPTVAPGEIRVIIGPNSTGKSSLVSIVSGLYRPGRGNIWLNGCAMRKVLPANLAGLDVTRTFQDLTLFKGLRVRDNIVLDRVQHTRSVFVEQLIGLDRAHHKLADVHECAKQMIHFVDLTEVQDQLVDTLPYGLRKHVELVHVLVARPRLLLFDESFVGMTVTEKVQMADLICVAHDQWGTTTVPTEHGIGLVLGLSDRVTVLDYGRKAADGMSQAVRGGSAVIDTYLDVAHVTADAAETQ